MIVDCPSTSRPTARVVLMDDLDRVLFLHAREGESGGFFWVTPGGGLEADESFEQAAIREVREETGLSMELGPCLWKRHHVFNWLGKRQDQFEVYFMARVSGPSRIGGTPDAYVQGHRWWTLQEVEQSDEIFVPEQIAELIALALAGGISDEPVESQVPDSSKTKP